MDNQMDMVRSLGLQLQPFQYTSFTEDVGIEWRKWLRSFETMARASRIAEDEWKRDLLLHYAGPSVQQLFDTLPELPESHLRGPLANVESYTPNMNCFEEAIMKLNSFFLPKENSTYERHLLRQMKQKSGETIDAFTIRLRVQAERCGFGDRVEENVKDQIIENCASAALRRDLLKRGDASLQEVLRVAKIFETVAQQEKSFVSEVADAKPKDSVVEVNRIYETANAGKKHSQDATCHRCGRFGHLAKDEDCPAKGEFCHKCNGPDHFAKKCRSRKRKIPTKPGVNRSWERPKKPNSGKDFKRPSDNVVKHITDELPDPEYVFNVTSTDSEGDISCEIGGVTTSAVIDSGSKHNLLSESVWAMMKSKRVVVSRQTRDVKKVFKAYGGQELTVLGSFTAALKLGEQSGPADFYVVKEDGKILIGRDTATAMGVLKINSTVQKIDLEDQLEFLGTIKDVVVDIPIKLDVMPVIQPYRRIPVALDKLVDSKIDELVAQGVVEKVEEPSKWVSPVVVVPKGDDVRICVDMRRANEAVERENHPLPTMEDFLPGLAKAKVFSRLDVKNAFHQVEISKKSRAITTFITRRGLYRYTRLMFGINCAPEYFQKIMEQILSDCDGCVNYIDDIIVYGSDQEEHDARLEKVRRKLKDMNVLLNHEKCVYGVTELKFLGHILSTNGIRPDTDKLESIRNFRRPNTAEETRSFLGLVNYVGKFIPNLATLTDPLRQLTKQSIKFVWNQEHQLAFDELKRHMLNPMTLGYFEVEDRTQLIADASPVGLGAILIQINKQGPRVISYASRSLSDVEKRYAQIEKEALALVWAVERFHFYLYGRSFELITDHKPLETIFSPRSKPCARIERWVIRLLAYKGKVVYRPGKSNIADPLSRLAITTKVEGKPFEDFTEHYVQWVATNATPVALKTTDIEQESKKDESIEAVRIGLEQNVWTENAAPFKPFATELCFAGEILLRGSRIVIPESLRSRTLELAHEGHPGMTLMKQRLRAKVWWPKLDAQVEKFVRNCRGCMLVAAPAAPEPLKRRELPSEPWQHVAIDYLGPLPSGHYLLVVVDYFSRYIEVEVMKKTDSSETIKRLVTIFARFGLPVSITSDNGPQFVSEEFREYCKSNNILLITTTPYWPQQNGEVERQNRSILKRLSISQATNVDWISELNKYLLMYRATPHTTTGRTPSELLFGYNIRDKLPCITQPKIIDEEMVDRDKELKEKGRLYADKRRNAKPSPITVGDMVLVKRMTKTNKLTPNFESEEFEVIERNGGDVRVSSKKSGVTYRRHVSHLQRINDEYAEASTDTNMLTQPSTSASGTKRAAELDGYEASDPEPRTKRVQRQPTYLQDYV